MSISVTGGVVPSRGEGWFTLETLNPSTATADQSLALHVPLTIMSTATGGTATATGFNVNRYTLSTASAIEGEEKSIILTGTGEYKIFFTGTATGAFVMTAANAHLRVAMLNRKWRVLVNSGATIATST